MTPLSNRSEWTKTKLSLCLLLLANAVAIGVIVYLVLFYPTDGRDRGSLDDLATTGMAKFEVSSGKADLAQAINRYLTRHTVSDGLSFHVELADDLKFRGDVRILGAIIRLEVGFEPIVQDNGDLLLKQQYFKVGGLRLPSTLVLEYVSQSYAFPEWIVIQPAKRQIVLAVTAAELGGGMMIRVREFDLAADKLRYEVWLP